MNRAPDGLQAELADVLDELRETQAAIRDLSTRVLLDPAAEDDAEPHRREHLERRRALLARVTSIVLRAVDAGATIEITATVWERLVLDVQCAADHAVAAVLRGRTGSAPRSARARLERLEQFAETETDKTLTKFCASAYNTLVFRREAVDRGSLAPWYIQEGIRDVEDVLLPLAKRLCAGKRRRSAVAGA